MAPLTTLPPDNGARSQSRVPVEQLCGDAANAGAAAATMMVGTAHAVPATTVRREIPPPVDPGEGVVRPLEVLIMMFSPR